MPKTARSYNDPCGIARALDLVGERWALLVVRELLLGPKRFTQLRHGLHEASANVLSQRLRELEQAGVVHRRKLGPPASTLVYELTERGYALEPLLLELGRWGSREPLTSASEMGVDALMIALKTRFDPVAAGDFQDSYELRVGEDRFRLRIAHGTLDLARGSADRPSATVTTDGVTLRAVIFGRQAVDEARLKGALHLDGDCQAFERLVELFAADTASPSGSQAAANPQAQCRPVEASVHRRAEGADSGPVHH